MNRRLLLSRGLESLRVGFGGLISHKLRSLLTMLGIVFGVSAVIAMLAVGEGAKREALAKYEAWGSSNIIIRDIASSFRDREGDEGGVSRGLRMEDFRALEEILDDAAYIVPQTDRTAMVRYGDENEQCLVVATTPELSAVLNVSVKEGRFLSHLDQSSRNAVAVLGAEIARELFHFTSPIGIPIKVDAEWFTVVGVMTGTTKTAESAGVLAARDLNRDIYISLGAELARHIPTGIDPELTQITVQTSAAIDIKKMAMCIKRIMDRRHFGADDYGLVVPEELIEQQQKEQRMFNIVLGAIAGISLLVGGIGIMNIMLASVLERRREIGVRRAMGARKFDILSQFLAEATMISLTGGLVGILFGLILSRTIDLLAEFSAQPTAVAIFLAFGVSVSVGIIFGYYPALHAAKTHPIEALRYE